MDERVLVVAIGCKRLPGIMDIAAKHGYVVFGMMNGQDLADLNDCPVYFYETGWDNTRKVVAVGNLDRVWSISIDDIDEEEFRNYFKSYYGAEWPEILDTADKSYTYVAFNDTFFAVTNLRLCENLTLLKLYRQKEISPLNIIVS